MMRRAGLSLVAPLVVGFVALLAPGAEMSAHAQPGAEPEPEPEPDVDEPAPDDMGAPAPLPDPAPQPQPAPPPQPVGPAPVPVPPGGGPGFDASPIDHQAHVGFFARGIIGFGYQQFTEDALGSELKVSGVASTVLLSIGYSFRPRLAFHFELGGVGMGNPTVEIDGMEFDTEDTTAIAVGIGPGLTYFLPSNAYVSGAVLFGRASIETNGDSSESDAGAAISLVGGKEWWVGSDLGLGVVGHLMVGGYPDSGDVDATVNTASFTINFSATYN